MCGYFWVRCCLLLLLFLKHCPYSRVQGPVWISDCRQSCSSALLFYIYFFHSISRSSAGCVFYQKLCQLKSFFCCDRPSCKFSKNSPVDQNDKRCRVRKADISKSPKQKTNPLKMSTVYLFKEISSHGALFNVLSCLVCCQR